MAGSTVTGTEYGYSIVGTGADATTINAGKIRVKALAFSGGADEATCALTSVVAGTAVTCYKFKCDAGGGGDLNAGATHAFFGDKGVVFNGLACAISSNTSHLYVYLV